MHFGLTEERVLLQETLRHFATEEFPPARQRECFDEGQGFDEALWRAAAPVGLQGLIVPESFGGSGLELLDLALAFEVLGEGGVPGPFLAHSLVALALTRSDDVDAQQKWLPSLASGDTIGGCAFQGLDDAGAPNEPNQTVSDGRLTGHVEFAEVGSMTDLILVDLGRAGMGLVEARATGVELEEIDGVDRSRRLATVRFEDAPIRSLSSSAVLGEAVYDAARILLAADAFGAAWKMIRMTTDYAQTREQFDTPIAQFQAVKHQIANMAKEAEPMRGLVWHAAYAFDHRPEECARDAATAKAHITDRAVSIGRDAVSLHGGIGFTWECDVHFFLKRAMHDRVWLGGPPAHRALLANLAGW